MKSKFICLHIRVSKKKILNNSTIRGVMIENIAIYFNVNNTLYTVYFNLLMRSKPMYSKTVYLFKKQLKNIQERE